MAEKCLPGYQTKYKAIMKFRAIHYLLCISTKAGGNTQHLSHAS